MMIVGRRRFGQLFARGMLAISLGVASMGASCGSVFADILTYVGIGLKAFSAVVAMLGPAAAAIAPIIALVNAAWANLQAAVNEYNSAPAANKSTLLGEIRTAIQALEDTLANFLAQLPASGTLETTILDVITLIVSTLAGYAQELPGAAARTIMLHSRTRPAQAVTPVRRSIAEFRKEVNAQLAAGGYAKYQI